MRRLVIIFNENEHPTSTENSYRKNVAFLTLNVLFYTICEVEDNQNILRRRKALRRSLRKVNPYLKLLINARKKNLDSFTFNGNTYVKKANPIKHLPPVYKKK